MSRCQFLLDFCQFELDYTGEDVGKWLIDSHTHVVCEPYFIVSHFLYDTGNAGKSIEVFGLSTIYERSGMIFSEKYDAHQINMTGKKASGTSSHKVNINPDIGKSLTHIHKSLVRIGVSVTRMKLYDNIRK